MDDFLVATNDKVTHRERVDQVLEWLQKLDLYLKPGVILENGTVTMDPMKVAGVADWKMPRNVRDIRKFLKFVNFYRCFIPNFSKKAKPMIHFEWKQEQEDAFQELKQAVQMEPVLLQPDQEKPFKVEIDASNYAIGAVLMQKNDKEILHPVAYFSKSLNAAQRNL